MEHDRWRLYVFGYLAWLVMFAVVEGAGRHACRMPTARWIAAGADARDRTMREWFRDRADECLDRTAWYSYPMAVLFTLGLTAPLAVVWISRKPIFRFATARPFFTIKTAVVLYGGTFLAALAVTFGTMEGVRWLYDWAG